MSEQTPSELSLQRAAQAWCSHNSGHIEMDTALATEFAKILDAELAELRKDVGRLRYRINLADSCILWLTAGGVKETSRGFELAKAYMRDYGDHPDNALIDAAIKEQTNE